MKRKHLYDYVDLEGLHLKEIPDSIAMDVCHGTYDIQNNKITSLKNAPSSFVKGNFICDDNLLGLGTGLKYGPEEVQGTYNCSGNKLASLDGIATLIGPRLTMDSNRLTSLKGLPTSILNNNKSLSFNENRISSLEGYGFESVEFFEFFFSNNNVTLLRGGPTIVQTSYDCTSNLITSFEGGPTHVGRNFYAMGLKNLKSLKGLPSVIGGSLFISLMDMLRIFPDYTKNDRDIVMSTIRDICRVGGRIMID
jgi:Leucine-rich repeat (LRR) protein